ncbi:MAG: GTPase ObgE [Pirellulales bacterium]
MFVDRVQIEVQAGDGGNGCCSFRREKYVPRGGPDGGNGGDGGSVIIRAKPGVDSLAALAQHKHWRAVRGQHGQGSDCHGRKAADLIIDVPPGTLVIDARDHFVLKDLAQENDQVIAARGGRGGKGNLHFKSSTNRAPRQCTPGEEGEIRRLVLELKLIADVGLIGKPNAGKSTALSRLTRARPEIADYPFTTKHPNLGIVELFDRTFVLADIPGLIEGAHLGVGLGHEFLRHVERTRVLVHLVEPSPTDESDPIRNYWSIRDELRQYDASLAERPEIIAVSKAELPGAEAVRDQLIEETRQAAQQSGRPAPQVLLFSAATGVGVTELLTAVLQLLDQADAAEAHD